MLCPKHFPWISFRPHSSSYEASDEKLRTGGLQRKEVEGSDASPDTMTCGPRLVVLSSRHPAQLSLWSTFFSLHPPGYKESVCFIRSEQITNNKQLFLALVLKSRGYDHFTFLKP